MNLMHTVNLFISVSHLGWLSFSCTLTQSVFWTLFGTFLAALGCIE